MARTKTPFFKENARFADAKNVLAFVDGHVSYTKIYYDRKESAWKLTPPAAYSYQWRGE